MNPPPLRRLGIAAAAAAAVLCWYLLTMEPAAAPRTAGKVPAAAAAVTGRGLPPPPAQWPGIGSREFQHLARARALPWLDARGRDAAGLVALWDLTGDESFLTEAAEKSPRHPRVCIAVIGHESRSGTVAKILPLIGRLITAQPQNAHAWHLKAWVRAASNDQAAALAALKQAAAFGGPSENFIAARAATVREAALAAGMSPGNAARLAIGTPLERETSCRVIDGICRIIRAEFDAAKAPGNEDRLMKIIGLGIVTAERITGPGPVTLRDANMANQLARGLLADLPDDTELGPAGHSVASLKSELESHRASGLKAYLLSLSPGGALERLRTASDDNLTAYAASLLAHGEPYAISTLLAQPPP